MKIKLVLASNSIARKNVLNALNINYEVYPSNIKEETKLIFNETYEDVAMRLAFNKAKHVADKLKNTVIISADSFAVLDNMILGKPLTKANAFTYLKNLSGKSHVFYTGMTLYDTIKQKHVTNCSLTKVKFRNLTDEEIKNYIVYEDVLNAAGSYKIQSLGASFIEEIRGDYYAVIGISLSNLALMLNKLGYSLFDFIKKDI